MNPLPRRIPPLNILLFLLTCVTTLMAGAAGKGIDITAEPSRLLEGYSYSISIMSILLVHEFGHYFASRAHRVDASLPYFIPVPPPFIFGTMGAVIRMKSPIMTRGALIDIGAMGPIAGFVVALVITPIGLAMSEMAPMPAGGELLHFMFGDSLIFTLISWLVLGPVPEGMQIILHPVALAGWIGMFVTMLNLLPVGQLDGGHIVYALLGPKHEYLGAGLVALLAAMGLLWTGWLIWAFLLVVLGLRHPPVYYWEPRLDRRRKLMALAAVVIFFLTFMPVPVSIQ